VTKISNKLLQLMTFSIN